MLKILKCPAQICFIFCLILFVKQLNWRFRLQADISTLCNVIFCILCRLFGEWAWNSWFNPGTVVCIWPRCHKAQKLQLQGKANECRIVRLEMILFNYWVGDLHKKRVHHYADVTVSSLLRDIKPSLVFCHACVKKNVLCGW